MDEKQWENIEWPCEEEKERNDLIPRKTGVVHYKKKRPPVNTCPRCQEHQVASYTDGESICLECGFIEQAFVFRKESGTI